MPQITPSNTNPNNRGLRPGPAFPKKAVKLSPYHFRRLVKQAYKRDNYTCQLCFMNIYDPLTPHHIVPRSRIHLDILENLLTAHCKCHSLLHDGLLVIDGHEKITVDYLIDKYGLRHYLR